MAAVRVARSSGRDQANGREIGLIPCAIARQEATAADRGIGADIEVGQPRSPRPASATVGEERFARVAAEAGGDMDYEWMRYVVTRYEPGDGPENQLVSFMRSMFRDDVLNHPERIRL